MFIPRVPKDLPAADNEFDWVLLAALGMLNPKCVLANRAVFGIIWELRSNHFPKPNCLTFVPMLLSQDMQAVCHQKTYEYLGAISCACDIDGLIFDFTQRARKILLHLPKLQLILVLEHFQVVHYQQDLLAITNWSQLGSVPNFGLHGVRPDLQNGLDDLCHGGAKAVDKGLLNRRQLAEYRLSMCSQILLALISRFMCITWK